MHRYFIPAVALCLLLPACSGVKGSGVNKTETREVGNFTGIEAGGVYTLDITAGRSKSVQVSGDDNIVPLVTTELRGERLVVTTKGSIQPKATLKLTISAPVITLLSISGAAKVNLRGMGGESFQLKVSGAAKATLAGAISRFELDGSGACNVDASKMPAASVMINLSGAGKADVNAIEKLMVKISGAGKVRYNGRPQLTEEIDGVGKVEQMQ